MLVTFVRPALLTLLVLQATSCGSKHREHTEADPAKDGSSVGSKAMPAGVLDRANAASATENVSGENDRPMDSGAGPAKRIQAHGNSKDAAYTRIAQTMGTKVSVSIWTDDEAGAATAVSAVFSEFDRVNRTMSSWLPDSDVARINAAAGKKPVAISAEVFKVIERSVEISRATDGAFDITIGAFRGLWKFDQDIDGSIPSDAAVKKRKRLIGYRKMKLGKARTVFLPKKGMRITLGGIAKGYAVDRAVALLRERGFNDFIVQAGGDLYVSGRHGDRAWNVGIRDPRGDRADSFALLELENGTFSTSGDYERSLIKNHVRYHHIIAPDTGYPATRSRSVTVLAKDAITADVWSTSLFIIGPAKGMPMVESMKDVDAVFVDNHNRVSISSGLRGRLTIAHPPTEGI